MKYILIILLMVGAVSTSMAQVQEKYFSVEAGYLVGVGNINYDDQVKFANNGNGYRLRIAAGWFISQKISLGVGLGLDGYHNPGYNTLPVYFELKNYLKTERTGFYGYANAGYAVKIGNEFQKGLNGGVGVGYSKVYNNLSLNPSVGLNLQQVNNGRAILIDSSNGQPTVIETKIVLKSIAFNLALVF